MLRTGLALALLANLAVAASPEVPKDAERIELLSDTLRPYAPGRGTILHTSTPQRYELADGSALVLDHATPAGLYRLANGRSIEIRRPPGVRMQITYWDRPVRVLPFVLQTSSGAGLVVQAIGDTAVVADSATIRGFLQQPIRWLGAEYEVWNKVGTRYVDISADWCANGHVPMPDTLRGLARITWLTFDTNWAQARRDLLAAKVRSEGRISEYAAIRDGLRRQPLGAVVGSVIVDLASGRVIQRRGRIR